MLHHTSPDDEQTWTPVVLSPRPPPSPPAPIPIPSPAPGARGLPAVEPDLEFGADAHTTLDDDDHHPPGRRSIVEGFINGLKRLPRALITKSYHPNERKTDRPPTQSFTTNQNDHPPPPTTTPHSPSHSHSSLSTTSTSIPTPTYVQPKPTSDYAVMDPPPQLSPEPSLSSYLIRLRQFLKAINDLPWIAPRTTIDYIPGQFSNSERLLHPSSRRETHLSWYAAAPPHHHTLDLLSSGSLGAITRLPDSNATLVYQPHTSSNKVTSQPAKHARCLPSLTSDPVLRPPPPAWTS